RRGPTELCAVDPCDAVHAQPARRQRLRRGRRDRRTGGDCQRHRRRAEAARRQACRDAGDARKTVARDPAEPGPGSRGNGKGPMYEFDYHRPTSLDDVTRLLGDEEAKLVAGGMTLVPTLKLRLAKPSQLIELAAIPSLKGITEDGDGVVIGAMTRHAEVNRSDA